MQTSHKTFEGAHLMKPNATSPISYQLADAETVRLEQAAVITSKLSHDFGNYLTGIMGFAELSLLQAPVGGTLQGFLHEVFLSAKDGAAWVQRLHHFCRRTSFPAWPSCVGLTLADQHARLVRGQRDGLVLRMNIPADLPMVAVDAEALSIIFRELTVNTSEATDGNGTLEIYAQAVTLDETECAHLLGSPMPGQYVELSVSDNGPALDPKVREKLLTELFFSDKPKLRGLGLWMIYGLIRRYAGGIRLFSPHLERGFGVVMVLPIAHVPKFETAEARLPVVLMLADPIRSANMGKLLEAAGCMPIIVSSSSEALESVTKLQEHSAVAVVDTQFGEESGLDLARRMLTQNAAIRFVFLHPQISYQGLSEEDLFKRFPLLHGPLEVSTFFQAIGDAHRTDMKKGK